MSKYLTGAPKKPHLNDEGRAELVRLYVHENWAAAKVAKRLGVSIPTVYRVARVELERQARVARQGVKR